LQHSFKQVSWTTLEGVLHSKPDMYQLWLSKQCIGICATRHNMAQSKEILDNKCPNCGQDWETSSHLNWCPNDGRSFLYKECIRKLATWMHHHDQTDPELAYWIEKYLLYCDTRFFTSLVNKEGSCSIDIRVATASQDLMGWTEFLHGKVLVEIATIQQTHCGLSPCADLPEMIR
jgi:hypothetical protein